MLRSNPWQSYRKIATQTASPGQLVLMLFEGAIRFLEHARSGFEVDDPLQRNQSINNNILRAQAIIHELRASLDMERGGEFAARMQALYDYFDRRLQESNVLKRDEGLIEVVSRLTEIRDAWAEMLAGKTVSTTELAAVP